MNRKGTIQLLNEIIPLPTAYEYRINEEDEYQIEVYKNNVFIEAFIVDSYDTIELLELKEEIDEYL